MNESDGFDYIVVGGGSAGCVIANRLSADPAMRVALIEAGGDDRRWPTRWKTDVPVGNFTLLVDRRFNWMFGYEAGANDTRAIPVPRGRILGGSGQVNGQVYMRGHASDYDAWEAAGNPGWGWNEVLRCFRQQEDHEGGENEFHGVGGELRVSQLRQKHPASHAFIAAAGQLQHRRNDDFNGAEMDGFGFNAVKQKNGQRVSAAHAFIHPIRQRANLEVLTDSIATRIRFAGRRAVGLEIRTRGVARTLAVRRELILSGGAVNSPQLLLLSGVGPAAHLQAMGIELVHDLPGVGRNLQDHATCNVLAEDRSRTAYALRPEKLPHLAREALRYVFARRGTLASNAVEAGGFVRTRPGLPAPDIQYVFMAARKDAGKPVPTQYGFLVNPVLLRPESRGFLELASPDPLAKPRMVANFLSTETDLRTMLAGVALVRRILAAPAFGEFYAREVLPGPDVVTEQQQIDYAHRSVATIYHPAGSCKMGPASDALAVVDPRLRVHGLAGIRVADVSIMPTIVSGNTSAPGMMIGERAAEFLRGA